MSVTANSWQDVNGNPAAAGVSSDFTVDTTAPSAPTVHDLADPANASYDAGSTVTAGAAVSVAVNGSTLTSTLLGTDFVKTTNGVLDTYAATSGAFSGTETVAVSATVTDVAGNVSAPGTLTLKPIDTTAPVQPAITTASYVGSGSTAHWNLGGAAEAGSTVTVYDGANMLGTTAANGSGGWAFATTENNSAIRDYSVTATDAAGNKSISSAAYFEGTPGNDMFSFASEAALSAAALINGGLGTDTVQMTSLATLTDADFAHFQSIEILGLTGASSITLATNALADGLATVNVGNGSTSVADIDSGTLTVNATALGAGNLLTLAGSTADTVTGLTGNLAASGDSGALSATVTGATAHTVVTGSGAMSIVDTTAGGSVTVDATALGTKTLTLKGSASEAVNNLTSNVVATGLSGALSVTTGATVGLSIAAGTGSTIINAAGMTSGETLTLTGVHKATLSVGGSLAASGDTGALTVTATGTAAHTIQTGSGADSISATHGGDTIQGGGGGDSIDVLGHTVADTFAYAAKSDSPNTTAGHDTITGFAASDLLDFSKLNPLLTIGGQVSSGGSIAANTIDWVNLGGSAMVYVNDTNHAYTTTNSNLMEITLAGMTGSLSAHNFRA